MHILFATEFKGYGYGSLMVQVLGNELRQRGIDVSHMDLRKLSPEANLHSLYGRCALMISFGARSLTNNFQKTFLHRQVDARLFCPFGDNPFYKMIGVDMTLPDVIYGFNDTAHVEQMRYLFPQCSNQYLHFPHFPLFPIRCTNDQTIASAKVRRIYFAGSAKIMFRRETVSPEAILNTSNHRRFYEKSSVRERLLNELGNNRFALEQYLYEAVPYSPDKLREFGQIYIECDLFLRATRRLTILKWLSNLPLTIIGIGWEASELSACRTVELIPALNYIGAEALVRPSFLVGLNIFQNQRCAPHDRIFNAASAGQVLVSDVNEFLEDFPDNAVVRLRKFDRDTVIADCTAALDTANAASRIIGLQQYLTSRYDLSVGAAADKVIALAKE